MAYMPSAAYIARAIFEVGKDKEWDEADSEEQDANMEIARVALAAVLSWQAQHRPDGLSTRYVFERSTDPADQYGWEIYDKKNGRDKPLGVVHDALLAQQIVDDLNRHDVKKPASKPNA
jgi:hypothetical protein